MDIVELWMIYWPKWTGKSFAVFVLFIVVLVAVLSRMLFSGKMKKTEVWAAGILAVYIMLVFESTVFTRTTYPDYNFRLEVFWSYRWGVAVYGGEMIREVVLNICMLIPVGVLLPVAIGDRFSGKCGAALALSLVCGFCCSAAIEFLQLFFRRGIFEFDDMIHNTAGVVVGYQIWNLLSRCFEKRTETE